MLRVRKFERRKEGIVGRDSLIILLVNKWGTTRKYSHSMDGECLYLRNMWSSNHTLFYETEDYFLKKKRKFRRRRRQTSPNKFCSVLRDDGIFGVEPFVVPLTFFWSGPLTPRRHRE